MNNDSIRFETTYYSNGQIKDEVMRKGAALHGVALSWHPNGVMAVKGYFIDDLPHGKFTNYDRFGNVIFEAYYLNGVEISSGPLLREVG